jgi:hypothetical protein
MNQGGVIMKDENINGLKGNLREIYDVFIE